MISSIQVFLGAIGAGKTFHARQAYAARSDNAVLFSFATPLKQLLQDSMGCTKEQPYVAPVSLSSICGEFRKCVRRLFAEVRIKKKPDFDAMEAIMIPLIVGQWTGAIEPAAAYRRLCQDLGTFMRDRYNLWVALAENRLLELNNSRHYFRVIVDDCRRIDEFFTLYNHQHRSTFEPVWVQASVETCAYRRGLTVEQYMELVKHKSEREIKSVIFTAMGVPTSRELYNDNLNQKSLRQRDELGFVTDATGLKHALRIECEGDNK